MEESIFQRTALLVGTEVFKRIEEVKKSAGTLSANKLTILAAIYLAAESYFGAKKIDSIIKKISLMENYMENIQKR